jgi:IclR family transcriptional regulator, KDG regulon repressor
MPGTTDADTAIHTEISMLEGRGDLATVQSVDKALMVVELLMRTGEAMTAREIALQTGINRTTGHRLLNALMHRGWIEKEPNSAAYRISLRFLVLSNLSYQQRNVLSEMRPTLERLSCVSRETVHVGVLDGFALIHVDKVDSPERVGVSSKIGTRTIAHAASLGKAILAASSQEIIDAYISHATRLPPPNTLTDTAWLLDDILQTRVRGYSIDDEEDSVGVRCIGSAIIAGNGEPVFAISITGPAGRFTMDRARQCAPALLEATALLSRDFGWNPATNGRTTGT